MVPSRDSKQKRKVVTCFVSANTCTVMYFKLLLPLRISQNISINAFTLKLHIVYSTGSSLFSGEHDRLIDRLVEMLVFFYTSIVHKTKRPFLIRISFKINCAEVITCRSQWPCSLKHELSSLV